MYKLVLSALKGEPGFVLNCTDSLTLRFLPPLTCTRENVDALIDGLGAIDATARRPIEFRAPGIMERQPVCEPVQTGLLAIDAMVPIGRGTVGRPGQRGRGHRVSPVRLRGRRPVLRDRAH